MAQHADQPLEGEALLLAQRAREIGQHEELVRPTLPAIDATARLEPAGPAGERELDQAWRIARERGGEAQRVGAQVEGALGGQAEQGFTATIEELEPARVVECEYGDVDRLHHPPQEPHGFDRIETLLAQRVGERVDLVVGEPQGAAGVGAPRADGVVALTQRGEQVGERLEGGDHVAAQRDRAHQPGPHGDHREGEAHARAVWDRPQEGERDQQRGRAAG